jgi:hypothetical protein
MRPVLEPGFKRVKNSTRNQNDVEQNYATVAVQCDHPLFVHPET